MRISDWSSDVCSSDLDADLFEIFGEFGQRGIIVELAAVLEAAGPGKDRRDRVGRGRLALLVHPIMAGYGAVRGLRFHRLAVGGHQHAGPPAQGAAAPRARGPLEGARVNLATLTPPPPPLPRPRTQHRTE